VRLEQIAELKARLRREVSNEVNWLRRMQGYIRYYLYYYFFLRYLVTSSYRAKPRLFFLGVGAMLAALMVPSYLVFNPAQPTTPARPARQAAATTKASTGTADRATKKESLPVGDVVKMGPAKADLLEVSQLGYLPSSRKVAVVKGKAGDTFKVVDTKTGKSVYASYLTEANVDINSYERVRQADFSDLTTPGEYALVVEGQGTSYTFRIGEDIYNKLFTDAVASYDRLAKMAPSAWHNMKAYLNDNRGKSVDVTGGWPDAGDYGKYMPTAAGTMGELLLAAELFPDKVLGEKLDVQLSGQMPDYLKVAKVELDWMLKMQREDGAVYDKVTPENFGPFSKSDADLGGTQYVYEVSTPDTGLFAATMAQAARVYKPYDAQFAQKAQAAAEKAWGFLEKNKQVILPPLNGGTGGYVVGSDDSHRFWAAAELFKTTGQSKYNDFVRQHVKDYGVMVKPLSWIDTTTFGLFAYYFNDKADKSIREEIRETVTTWADDMANMVTSPINSYLLSLSTFEWSSNKTALDNGVILLVANEMKPNQVYVNAALDQLYYVTGRNALSKSFITGYGANPVRSPHNRSIFATGKMVPGVMVGGPNEDAQDGIAPAAQGAKSYVDDMGAYSVNENSIEYNAPLVFLTGYFKK